MLTSFSENGNEIGIIYKNRNSAENISYKFEMMNGDRT